MPAIIQRLPRRKQGIKECEFIVGQQEAICLYPKPAEVLVRFKLADDELHMRTECQDLPPGGWYLVPPGGKKVIGIDLHVWVIDTDEERAVITLSTQEEARKWQLNCISKVLP